MSTHTISHANNLQYGDAYRHGANNGRRGIPFNPLTLVTLGAALAVDGDGLAAGLALADGVAVTIAETLDVPRNVTVTPGGDDSLITYTVRGSDAYARSMTETIAGANLTKVSGAKAFTRVESITANGAPAGPVNVGWGRALGLPFAILSAYQNMGGYTDAAADAGTLVLGDSSAPTAITGDVRGTYDPETTPDGATAYYLWVYVDPANAYGGAQA